MQFLSKANINFYKNFRLPKIKFPKVRMASPLSLFIRDEPIYGLEISDSFLRLAVLETVSSKRVNSKDKKIIQLKGLAERSLKKGIIENGEIKNKKALVEALGVLLGKSGQTVNYVIASISGSKVYSKAYSFPKTVVGEKLEEAMKLNVDFQLPFSAENIYFDWEKIESSRNNDVLLAASFRTFLDKYLEVLSEADLKTVAVEFYGASIARAINLKEDQSALVAFGQEEGMEFYIIKKNFSKFGRFLPSKFFPNKKSLEDEIKGIINFFENEDKSQISYLVIANEPEKNNFPDKILPSLEKDDMIFGDFVIHADIKKSPEKWLVAAGAAIRGLLPRREDSYISLMPIGTEEAYEQQKAISFIRFISALVIGLSGFFVFAFIGSLILMMSVERGFNKRLSILNSIPINNDSAILTQRAEKLNSLLVKATNVLVSAPRWSANIAILKSQLTASPGIVINMFSMSPAGNSVSVKGVAKDKTSFNSLRKKMEDSGLFSNIAFPPVGLFQVNDIPFSISFTFLKTMTMLEREDGN